MKHKMKLRNLLPILPADLQDYVASLELPEDTPAVRKCAVSKTPAFAEGERAAIQYVSTRDVDRDQEILVPEGAVLDEFRKAPQVLWGHDYSEPPIGSDEWIKVDSYGLKAKTVYASTPRGEEIWTLKREGHLRTSSVGFIPLEYVQNGGAGWAEVTAKLAEKWEVKPKFFSEVGSIYTKWLLLEHSEVSVPANPYALTLEVAKGMGLSEKVMHDLGIDEDVEPEPEDDDPEPVVVSKVNPAVRGVAIVRPVPVVAAVAAPAPDIKGIVTECIARRKGIL